MSLPLANNDVPLPHAGLLGFLHRPTSLQRVHEDNAPPPYQRPKTSDHPVCPHANRVSDDDEESNNGFWGERQTHSPEHESTPTSSLLRLSSRRHKGAWAFCCFWCAISACILAAFGAFFALDLVFTQFGMGTGMARWMMQGSGRRDATAYKMRFCLATPNRQAPGPRSWRYMTNDLGACDTEVLILSAAATEQWKLLSDDFLVFDHNMPVVSGYEQARSVKEKIRLVELGDNLAEEGAATR